MLAATTGSLIAAAVIGLSLGIAIGVAMLWDERDKIRQRLRELLGIESPEKAELRRRARQRPEGWFGQHKALVMVVAAILIAGNVAIALITEDAVQRAVTLASAAFILVWVLISLFIEHRSRAMR
jgi:hypothetical protein